MAKKSAKKPGPSAKDAQIVMQLYDLRREAKMREARDYLILEFSPQSAEEVIKVATAFGTKENTYFRQVFSYWNMAAALVVQGALNKQLFEAWSSEMFYLWAKIQPYMNEVRAAMGLPQFLHNVETIIEGDPQGRKRRQETQARQKKQREMRAAASGR